VAGRIAVVDAHDRFVRWEGRKEVHDARLVHRSIHVLLLDSRDRLVIQLRHRQKQTYPSHWDLSASGHVEESDYPAGPDDDLDRVYREVAARELEEELGVRAALRELGHYGPEPGVHYEQIRLFTGRHDGPYVAQPDEVEAVTAVTRAGLLDLGRREPITHTLLWFAERLADSIGWR
jgi:isopentenyldiphosphate isomerase